MLYSYSAKKLSQLILEIEQGALGLPELQRPFLWPDTKVRDLFDSLFRGYPIGFLMLWDADDSPKARYIGTNLKPTSPKQLIIDGQQRLTSLYSVLRGQEVINNKFQKRKIIISFNPLKKEFKVGDKSTEKGKEWIYDISIIFLEKNIFSFTNNFINNILESRPELSENDIQTIQNNIGLLQAVQNTDIHCFQIPIFADEEEVSNIFVRVNSGGEKLKESDFILTLISLYWFEGRAKIETFCNNSVLKPENGKPSSYNLITEVDSTNIVRTALAYGFNRARLKYGYKLLRGADFEKKNILSVELREKRFEVLKSCVEDIINITNWHEYLKTVMSAGFVVKQLISSSTTVFYCYAFYLIAKNKLHAKESELKILMPKLIFFVTLTNRYSGSFESQMEQDLNVVKGFKELKDFDLWITTLKNSTLTDSYFENTLPTTPNAYLSVSDSTGRSPFWLCYCAALNVLDRNVLFSTSNIKTARLFLPDTSGNRKSLERHHLFPAKFLQKQGYSDKLINHIANFAFIDWTENSDIKDKDPKDYFPIICNKIKEEELNKMLVDNALPTNWHFMDYEAFLEQRRFLMATTIRKAIEKLFG